MKQNNRRKIILYLNAIFAFLFASCVQKSLCYGVHEKSKFDNFPRSVIQSPFYSGRFRKNGREMMITAGLKFKTPEDTFGEAYLWIFQRDRLGRWVQLWEKNLGNMAYCEGVIAFNAVGDATKQVGIYFVGADNISLTVYGFRGTNYSPKELFSVTGKGLPEIIQTKGDASVVEHWHIYDLLNLGQLKLPLPTRLKHRIYVKRSYRYNKKKDRYGLSQDFVTDTEREQSLTLAERKEEHSLIARLIQRRSQGK